ncbi:MAG: glycogen debranching protein [Chloroflexaceae bacterium]|nr:glycogen debranching protein [Chloroflexaceae bacterium]
MRIWVNEQIDPCGIVYSCIACVDEQAARECHESWLLSLSDEQKEQGWQAKLRSVESWEDVPVNALKLSY